MEIREIIFRGFCEHTKSWIVGNYVKAELLTVKSEYEHFIIEIASDGAEFKVLPKTVGQYTGLKDKNGDRIFEGDRLIYDNSPYNVYCSPKEGKIVYWKGALQFMWIEHKHSWYKHFSSDDFFGSKCTIIGNIHDIDKEKVVDDESL